MQVKQTTIALLICSLFASGSVLARGGLDVDVDDSFQNTDNNSHNVDVDKSDNNSFNDTDSNNTDKSDNNSFNDTDSYNTDKSDNNSYNDTDSNNKTYTKTYNKSFNYSDNSKDLDWSNDQEWITTNTLTDKMIAKSSVKGKLSDVSVSYSNGSSKMGYQPRGRRGGGHGGGDDCCGGMSVSNTNTLTGANGAAGITSIAQNVGGNALAQQSVSINTK